MKDDPDPWPERRVELWLLLLKPAWPVVTVLMGEEKGAL
jgi:hypothetical protein